MVKTLFSTGYLNDVLDGRLRTAVLQVRDINRDQFMASSEDTLTDHLVSANCLDPIELYPDQAVMDSRESSRVVADYGRIVSFNSTIIDIEVPFTGDASLFGLMPSSYRSGFPTAEIRTDSERNSGKFVIQINIDPARGADEVQEIFDREIESISFYTTQQAKQIAKFDEKLERKIRAAIQLRRTKLEQEEGLVRSLNIPLKLKGSAPSITPIKATRKLVRPLPPPPKSGFKAEPGITDEMYEHILGVIRHEGRSFEATPSTFQKLDEEEIRDIIIAHLNGHYEGGASGETFRKRGKTDITNRSR